MSCSLPASYLYSWAMRPVAPQNKRTVTILPGTKVGLMSFSHKAEFLECAVRQ